MARRSTQSIDDIIRSIIDPAVDRATAAIAKVLATQAAARFDEKFRAAKLKTRTKRASVGGPRRRPAEITKWVADRRARRVPNFVIEMTGGLDTKKKIVAKYGEGSAFEKGKPAPKPARTA